MKLNENTKIFIHENALENVVCLLPFSSLNVGMHSEQIIVGNKTFQHKCQYIGMVIGMVNLDGRAFPPGQNGCHFADDIFRCIFVNEKCYILNKISLNCVPKGPIDNIRAVVKIMAWCRIGDKPLSKPMLTQIHWRIYAALGEDELKLGCDVLYV